MPRKSKDELKNVTKNNIIKTISKSKKAATEAAEKDSSTKTSKSKKENSKVAPSKGTTKTRKTKIEASTDNKKTTTKRVSTRKSSNVKYEVKTSNTKIASSSKGNNSRKTTSKKASPSKTEILVNSEYYDLPYRYNQTTVKILAQTPNMLFVYWDISDDDRNLFIQKYGKSFFDDTKPVLIVTNKTMNYTFEVEINDFANSWYLHLNDPDCDYSVELGRRPKYKNTTSNIEGQNNLDDYIYVCTSNDMEMPNNHILFDQLGQSVFFKNTKTNFVEEKSISSLSFMTNLGKVSNVHDLYKTLYKDDINEEDLSSEDIRLNLSSSNSPTSSSFK